MNCAKNIICISAIILFMTACSIEGSSQASVKEENDTHETQLNMKEQPIEEEGPLQDTETVVNMNDSEKENEIDHPEKNNNPSIDPSLQTVTKQEEGKNIIVNPDNILAVVNKVNILPGDYKPSKLVVPNIPFYFDEVLPKKHMREEAARAIEQLFQKAKEDDINLVAASGYRSFERQNSIYRAKVNQVGEIEANQVVAVPGESEHQTGLAMDVTSADMNFQLSEEFAETKEGMWLKDHAHLFGFIIRYPKGKEEITGYQYEPWHLRYVGKEVAQVIYEQNITLEEYAGTMKVDKKVEESVQEKPLENNQN